MRLLVLLFCLTALLAAEPFSIELKGGKSNDVCLKSMMRDTLFVSANCKIQGSKSQIFAIPNNKVNHVCNDLFCIDLSAEHYLISDQNQLEILLKDTINFPYASLWLDKDKNQILRFFSFENDTLSFVGELESGQFESVKIHKKRIRGLEFENGKWLNLNLKNFKPVKDDKTLIDPLADLTIQSMPSGATIFLDGIEMGVTPLRMKRVNAGPREIKVQTSIIGQNYSATQSTHLFPGEKQTFYLNLKKESPKLFIKTIPSQAEIYFGANPDFSEASNFKTPFENKELRSGLHFISIFHPNYKDTNFILNINPFKPTIINLSLDSLSETTALTKRQQILDQRFKKSTFKSLQIASIPLFASALTLYYNAYLNRDEASHSRDRLAKPHLKGGTNFDELRTKNSDQFNRSNIQNNLAWSLLAGTLALQGIAWGFYF